MHWIYLILGLWLAASPWVADTLSIEQQTSSMVVGSLVAVLALWNLFGKSR